MDVELKQINKTFGKVHANDNISITFPSGTIQGILGENGAGKSTLMKILSGFYQTDSGQILLDGNPVVISDPAKAIQHGIGMLHQDPLDFPPMRVIDNFIIGQSGGMFPDRKAILNDFKRLQAQFGFDIDPDTYVDAMTVGERQQLEILRLLWLGAKVLIMDEPTTGISALQKVKLFETLRKLVKQGMTVLFVSHKLDEVEGLCTRAAVLRRGQVVGEITPPYKTQELVKLMFGKEFPLENRVYSRSGESAVRISGLSIEDVRLRVQRVNLEIQHGEVIGLAGMEGSGQRQFLRTLGGLMRPVGGKLFLEAQELTGKPYKAFMDAGVCYVPAARLEEGLIPGLSLEDHFILAEESKDFFINRRQAEALSENRIKSFTIHGTPASKVEQLSGGNQQRALLALMRTPLKLMLLEHPTRGLDIESTWWIWNKLKERCQQGTSIVFISSDLEEILRYSDRILVFFGGKVSRPIEAVESSVDQLGQLIGGKGF